MDLNKTINYQHRNKVKIVSYHEKVADKPMD